MPAIPSTKIQQTASNTWAGTASNLPELPKSSVREGDEQGILALHGYRPYLNLCAALSRFEADNTMHEAFNQKLASQIILQGIKLVHHVYLVKQNLYKKLIFSCID